jgi:hypothetical protein
MNPRITFLDTDNEDKLKKQFFNVRTKSLKIEINFFF